MLDEAFYHLQMKIKLKQQELHEIEAYSTFYFFFFRFQAIYHFKKLAMGDIDL